MGQLEEESLTLIDFINIGKSYFSELKAKWRFVSVFVCITSIAGLAYTFYAKPKYIATSTVMLETSMSGGSMSGAIALASQFGLLGGTSSSVIDEGKLVELVSAETIIKTALFKKVTIDSKQDILANHFIEIFGYDKAWENNDSLKGFRFTSSKENMSMIENRVFKMFYNQITHNFLTTEKSKSGIITIKIKTTSESFSKHFNHFLVESLTNFYVNRITEKGQMNVDIIQKRVDSISVSLRDAEHALARWKDANFQLVKAQGMMAEIDLRRNVEVCNSIYIEGVKQLEISKFTLLQDTPFLQIIDEPSFPIEPLALTHKRGFMYGFMIGCFLSIGYVFGRKKYKDLMTEAH